MTSSRRIGLEQVREAPLRPQVLLDRHPAADRRHVRDLAVLRLEDREEAGLRRQPGRPGSSRRVPRAPAQRARHQHVQVARAAQLHGALDLGLEVAQVGDGGGGDVRDLVRHRDQRRALALAERVARLGPTAGWSRCGRPAAWRRSAARRCSCSPRCRSRRTARRRCARTCRTGSRSRCRPCRRRRPGRRTRMSVAALAPAARPRPRLATAGALPNSECSHGTRQDVSGYGVEKTSRQPVALTATSWPPVARMAASST